MTPTPGIHRNVPSATYHQLWDAASASRLSLLARSPAHLRYAIDNPPQPTEAMELGSAIHAAILEPELFANFYAAAPKCDGRTKEGKAAKAECEKANAGKTILSADDYRTCLEVSASVWNHPAARALLASRDETEVCAAWKCPKTEVVCKMRADAVSESAQCIIDIKTTKDAGPDSFARSIVEYGYHVQAEHYLAGMAACGRMMGDFVFIAVEKAPPYGVAVYRLDDAALAAASDRRIRLLEQYKTCVSTGLWPCYSQQIESITMPEWAMRRDSMAVA